MLEQAALAADDLALHWNIAKPRSISDSIIWSDGPEVSRKYGVKLHCSGDVPRLGSWKTVDSP
jgi:hypothetical protein